MEGIFRHKEKSPDSKPTSQKTESNSGGNEHEKGRKINKVKCDIQSHIIAAGYTQKEAVEACSAEYSWSDSDSNFSAKLSDQTLRYREALELADVLGYEIVWQKRRDD